MNYETFDKANYSHVSFNNDTKEHILKDNNSGKLEIWVSNKNHASYGLIYKNTHLEFCCSFH